MKHIVVRTAVLATLLLCLAAMASAQGAGACSRPRLDGEWGYTFTGTIFLAGSPSPVAVPFAGVGRVSIDRDGSLSGAHHSSFGGQVAQETASGISTVNPDCTGTMTLHVYDESGNLVRSAAWATVLDDDATETRGIITSLELADGRRPGAVLTIQARRLVRNHGVVQ